jgi:hypothetical protein
MASSSRKSLESGWPRAKKSERQQRSASVSVMLALRVLLVAALFIALRIWLVWFVAGLIALVALPRTFAAARIRFAAALAPLVAALILLAPLIVALLIRIRLVRVTLFRVSLVSHLVSHPMRC